MTFVENIRQAFKDFVSRSQTERDQLLRQEFGVQHQNQPPQQGGQGMGMQMPLRTGGLGRGQ
jgi:ABC-type phosphonate transport system ATPase subunit